MKTMLHPALGPVFQEPSQAPHLASITPDFQSPAKPLALVQNKSNTSLGRDPPQKKDSKQSLTKNTSSVRSKHDPSSQTLSRMISLKKGESRTSQFFKLQTLGRDSIKRRSEMVKTLQEVNFFFDQDHSAASDSETLVSIQSMSDQSKRPPMTKIGSQEKKGFIMVGTLDSPGLHLFQNPISEAVIKNEKQEVVDLVNALPSQFEKNKKLNQRDRHRRTPLFYAIYHNNYEVVDFLLSQGADPLFSDD